MARISVREGPDRVVAVLRAASTIFPLLNHNHPHLFGFRRYSITDSSTTHITRSVKDTPPLENAFREFRRADEGPLDMAWCFSAPWRAYIIRVYVVNCIPVASSSYPFSCCQVRQARASLNSSQSEASISASKASILALTVKYVKTGVIITQVNVALLATIP